MDDQEQTVAGRPMRKLQRGEQPLSAEFVRIRELMEQNPGLSGERYKSLIREKVGISTTITTVYRWMKQFGIPTLRKSIRDIPLTTGKEQARLKRLLSYLIVPRADEVGTGWNLARTGVDKLRTTNGTVRLAWDEDGVEFMCWFTRTEAEFIEEILERADRAKRSNHFSCCGKPIWT